MTLFLGDEIGSGSRFWHGIARNFVLAKFGKSVVETSRETRISRNYFDVGRFETREAFPRYGQLRY